MLDEIILEDFENGMHLICFKCTYKDFVCGEQKEGEKGNNME